MAPAKILAVDDDPGFLRFVTELLIGAGYEVKGTRDPLLAADLARDFAPDLVILDLSMPGKDGIELAEELRAKAGTSGVRVMILSARKSAEGMEDAKGAGAVAYLEKPVQSLKLLWMVKALLDQGEAPFG